MRHAVAERFPVGYRYLGAAGAELVVAEQLAGDRYRVRTTDWVWSEADHAEIKLCRSVHRHDLYPIGARFRLPMVTGVLEIVEYKPHPTRPQIDYRVLNRATFYESIESHMYLAAYATFLEGA